ncbi:hypothetical protein DSM106972_065530 [Dulcicalothrix desertica PCC 7102]|uniref:Uncharacterized protein n=1 Tax=Dulcicalothrix desertica PCC 7102 TaxID=232991 RepID=A0A3S1AIA4_9CYAN|nr:hypothetical protein [Dulcicalothrix desertica]RUT01456.1 hypothetical protein DSM106972_065530 [Dulcicalothrix desertica PCC 7102]TWH43507.1 hypothetical protein CAL7102_07236 [Dulcicalothrix desertica PCC 7102]
MNTKLLHRVGLNNKRLYFEKKYALRAGIEGTISQGVRKFDMRRTRPEWAWKNTFTTCR